MFLKYSNDRYLQGYGNSGLLSFCSVDLFLLLTIFVLLLFFLDYFFFICLLYTSFFG